MENFTNQIKEKKLPKQLTEMLMTEIEKKNVNGVWLHQQEHQECSLLTISCKDKLLFQQTFDYLFIGNIFEQDRVLISILDDIDLQQHREDCYLFFRRYATTDHQIYGEEMNIGRFIATESDFQSLRERYEKGEQLLMKYTEELIADEQVGATLFTLKNIQHDLQFLEYLRFGKEFDTFTLTERLHHMEAFIPEMKKFFVKEGDQYYLLRQIENEDMVEYMDEHLPAICKIKKKMKGFVLQNMKVKQPKNDQLKPTVSHQFLKDASIKKVLRPLLQMTHLEEVYLFHEITSFQADFRHHHYYLLALVSKESAKEVRRVFQKINEALPPNLKFTIIYHTRFWIQENLYQSQYFLKTLMNNDHKIYTNDFHPKIHWGRDDDYRCDDSFIYHRRAKNIYERHLKRIERDEKSTMVFIIPCDLNEYFVQILINSLYDTLGYLREINDVEVLWNLSLYAHPVRTQLEEHLQKLSFDLIGYMSKNQKEKLPALHLHQDEKKLLFDLIKRIKNI